MTSDDKSAASNLAQWAKQASIPMLVAGLRAGTEPMASAAATEVWSRFESVIRNYWRRGRYGEYADFRQEVFVRLFEALYSLRDPAAFPGLFVRVVKRTGADVLRKQLRDPMSPHLRAEGVDIEAEVQQAQTFFDDELMKQLLVITYLNKLGGREREVMELIVYQDLDVSDIAPMLGITLGAVRSIKVRAELRLKSFAEEM